MKKRTRWIAVAGFAAACIVMGAAAPSDTTGRGTGGWHAGQSGDAWLALGAEHPRTGQPLPRSVRAWLRYGPAGPTFDFTLFAWRLVPRRAYELVYFPAPWPGDGLVCLGGGPARRFGTLLLRGSVEIDSDLPAPHDANYPSGAELWLVPVRDVDCAARRMVEWHPRRILFGRWLIHYRDTDRLPDLSDTWCVIESRPHATSSFSMEVVQDGDIVTITVDEITASGTLGGPDGRTLELTVDVPDLGEVTLVLTFDADGEGLSGHFDAGGDSATLSGSRGACFDYEFPPGDPVCALPVPDTSLVLGGQQFNSVTASVVHTGLDFRLETPLAEIVAPCDGVVTEINRGEISGGTLIVDVTIRYNDDWSTFVAFEPYSTDPAVVEQQEEEIAVSINQIVRRGDLLGRLVVPDPLTEYPHVHWGVDRLDPDRTPVCPRDALPPAEQAELDALYGSFGLLPACLPAP